jgi:hypothetical protein
MSLSGSIHRSKRSLTSGEERRSVRGGPSGWVVLVRSWCDRRETRASIFFLVVFCYDLYFFYIFFNV